MQCSVFYNQTKSVLTPTGFVVNANGCPNDVYFGGGYQVVFHDHWDADNISSLKLLQDISDWEGSSAYVEAHFYENGSEKCVSLSATNNALYDADVKMIHIDNGLVKIEGRAH